MNGNLIEQFKSLVDVAAIVPISAVKNELMYLQSLLIVNVFSSSETSCTIVGAIDHRTTEIIQLNENTLLIEVSEIINAQNNHSIYTLSVHTHIFKSEATTLPLIKESVQWLKDNENKIDRFERMRYGFKQNVIIQNLIKQR